MQCQKQVLICKWTPWFAIRVPNLARCVSYWFYNLWKIVILWKIVGTGDFVVLHYWCSTNILSWPTIFTYITVILDQRTIPASMFQICSRFWMQPIGEGNEIKRSRHMQRRREGRRWYHSMMLSSNTRGLDTRAREWGKLNLGRPSREVAWDTSMPSRCTWIILYANWYIGRQHMQTRMVIDATVSTLRSFGMHWAQLCLYKRIMS